MRPRTLLAFTAGCLLSPALSSQSRTYVSPAAFANREAPSGSYYPLSRVNSVQTYRQLHTLEVHDLPTTAVGKLGGIAYRRDGYAYAGQKSPACWIDLEVAVSSAKTTSKTMSSVFANNEGTDRTVVIARKKVNFASYPFIGNSGQVQPFFLTLPFDTGKVLVFKGGSISVDIKSYDNNLYDATTRQYRYLYLDRAYNSTGSMTRGTGRACYSSDPNNFLPFYGFAYAYYYRTTSKLRLYGYSYYGLQGGAGLMLLAGKPLPTSVPLPGGCYLHIDPGSVFLAVPGSGIGYGGRKTTSYYYPPYQGNTRQYLELPWQNSFRGAKLYVQMVGIDPKANSLGLTFTNRTDMTLPLYDPNGLPVSYTYTWGPYFSRTYGYGPYKSQGAVTQFKFL